MRLFGKKKEFEEEMEDLDKLTSESESTEIPQLPPELTKLKEVATAEAEEITEKFEEPKTLPEPVEVKRGVQLEELPLKELNEKIDRELKEIRKRMKDLGALTKLSLDSPEMVTLMEVYTEYKEKLNGFVEEINNLDLTALSSNRTFAAIYKFKACKGLSEIKREIKKIESICKKAGFIPTKVHEILEARAEDLVDGFLQGKQKEE